MDSLQCPKHLVSQTLGSLFRWQSKDFPKSDNIWIVLRYYVIFVPFEFPQIYI